MTLTGASDFGSLCAALFPCCYEHGLCQIEEILGRLKRADQRADIVFKLVARDRFPVALAGFGLTKIIGIGFSASLAKGRPQRYAAIGAFGYATQGKFVSDILARWCVGNAIASRLNLLKGFDGDQRLMVPPQPVYVVGFAAYVAGVERLRQDIDNPLLGDDTLPVARKIRKAFKKPPDFRLRLKPSHGIALKGVADDRGQRLVEPQHLAPAPDGFEAIADRRFMGPVTGLHPGFHLLGHLTTVLLALKSALRGHDGFDEFAFGALVELEVQALDLRAASAERITQIEEKARVAAESFQVVEDHHEVLVRLRIEKAQQRDHAGPFHEVAPAGYRVREDRDRLIVFQVRVLAATVLLAFKAASILLLRF